ncbi:MULTISPECIES: hypothetical protein [Catenuloplanes]|uniref:Uncharacterized protein n=1 Tax=Catenuloplanes niger TaxID=587534 RepID=A0AAE3ZVL1_9ACTN|nr:hypothetical protein [Catenuloplanes niger]MDR7325944.1 hypothetical protein [Catenuloplanes niger]
MPDPVPEHPAVDPPTPVDGLCDLVLVRTGDGGLARPEAPGTALTAEELTDYAQECAVPGKDLRVLVDDGARSAKLLSRVADALDCDILVTPTGATVERLPGPGGTHAEAVPVDRVSGEVVDWKLVQPARLATTLPGWFDLAGGLVLPRAGLATLPLPGGLEFANREDFVVRRAAAARLGVGHPDLVTVALATRDGGFRLSTYRPGASTRSRYTGRDVAAALSSIYLYGGDLRLWMRWPEDEANRTHLEAEMAALAEATGATVWAPAPGDEAVLLRGSRDLAARDRSGAVSRWAAFRPPDAPETGRFTTDRDGRLVPRGGPAVLAAGGVSLISTGRQPEDALRERYADLTAEPGTALIDLTVLDDGRLALRYADGSNLAVGVAELRALLAGSGWAGEDLLLVTPVLPERASGLRGHLALLEPELGVEIWSLPPGATVVVRDGLPRAVDEQLRPARWLRAGKPGTAEETGRWRNDDGWLIPRRRHPASSAATPVVTVPEPMAVVPPPERVLPAPSPRPSLTVPGRGSRRHGVRWLPDLPEVNAEPIRLWVTCAWTPQRVAVEGVPSANLFLMGALDGERLARDNPQKHLLCLRVEAGAAVDLGRVEDVPADLKHLAAESGTFLLPAGWLDQARLSAGYRIDEDGRPVEHAELPENPVVLRCTGARHGTEGLPNDVVTWPKSDRGGGAWALLPEKPEGDFLPLHPKRPAVRAGHRLVHVQVPANRAIDVTASATGLVGLTSVRSRLPELVAAGVSLLLPKRSWERTRVDQVLQVENERWKHSAKGIDLPLASLLTPGP